MPFLTLESRLRAAFCFWSHSQLSPIPRQLALSSMRFFPRTVEHAFNMTVHPGVLISQPCAHDLAPDFVLDADDRREPMACEIIPHGVDQHIGLSRIPAQAVGV
jgi:hypothetical protein